MNTIWEQGGARIIRHFEGCYTLEYLGRPVLPATDFETVARYVWAEFL